MFVLLEEKDLVDCVKPSRWVCPIQRAVHRKQESVACITAIVLNQIEDQNRYCPPKLVPWAGTYTKYLGNRKWVYSRKDQVEMAITCEEGKHEKTRRIPPSGILEIPPGCSAHTDEWVLPASFQRSSIVQLANPLMINFTVPSFPNEMSLPVVRPGIDKRQEINEVQSISDMIHAVISRNKQAIDLAGTSVTTLRNLARYDDWGGNSFDPVSSTVGTLALVLVTAFALIGYQVWMMIKRLMVRIEEIGERLTAHEQIAK